MPIHYEGSSPAEIGKLFWKNASGVVEEISKAFWKDGAGAVSEVWSGAPPLSSLPEGSLIRLNENNSPQHFIILRHLNGRTWLTRKWLHSKIAWKTITPYDEYSSSTSDVWLNTTYLNLFDLKVRELISEIPIQYTPGFPATEPVNINRRVWYLSGTELGLATGDMSIEGTAIAYFISNAMRLAYFENAPTVSERWWTRSRRKQTTNTGFVRIITNGALDWVGANSTFGARPSFTLPVDTPISEVPNPDGSYNIII